MANTRHLGLLTAVGLLVTWLVVIGCGEQENAPQIKVAFVRESDSNVDIYLMNADSSSQTRLTDNREIDVDPSGSPDGKKIAFASNRDGNFDIYTMSAEGSGVTNLTQDPYDDRQPTWSPDGKKIAFASNRSGNFDIYVMNADGSGVTNLTQVPLSAELLARLTQKYPQSDEVLAWLLNDQLPAWSPDGKKIAFASNSRGNFDIYVMNADGTTRTRITTNDADDGNPYWSPDGKRIAFASNRDGEMFDIFVMGADGSTVDNLTNNPANDLDPVWLPDGKKIAFASNRHNDWDLYRMTPDGTKQTHLTSDRSKETLPAFFAVESSGSEPEQASEKRAAKQSIAESSHPIKLTKDSKFHSPIWSPDGKKIAMLGDDGIYVMNADGSKVTNLSNYVATGGSLAWSPDGEKIAFASDRSGNSDVYIMNADGSGVTDLTGNPEQDAGFGWSSGGEHGTHVTDERGNDRFPEWSPSGEKIAFTSDRDGNVEIYVMNADGSGVTNLTHNPAADGSSSFEESDAFAWSPDGEKIVFQSDRDAAIVGEIYVMNADGSGVTNLTHYQGYDASPRWSPDGKRISFHSGWGGGGGFPDVYVMNADGTDRTRLTNNTRASTDWSPNGKQIVVSSLHGDRRVDNIYVMNADGSGVTNLTHYSEQEPSDQDVLQIADPHWSPDGKRILFTRTSGTPALGIQENIYVMDVEVEN